MNVVILQLSDIHIDTPEDRVLQRSDAIARITNSVSYPVDLWVLLLTGDIARRGAAPEYGIAEHFILSVRERLRAFHPASDVRIVAVPGNHDCDFTLDDGVRSALLPSIHRDAVDLTPAVISACLKVQQPFFDMLARLEGTEELSPRDALSFVRQFSLGSATIRFNCYNTAWVSQRDERRGDLSFPLTALRTLPPVGDGDRSPSRRDGSQLADQLGGVGTITRGS